jgi:hypothetical protein
MFLPLLIVVVFFVNQTQGTISSTCMTGCLTLTHLKIKERNRLISTPNMCVALSTCIVDWDEIMKSRQSYKVGK